MERDLAIRRELAPNFWTTYQTWSQVGGSLLGQKRYAEAEPHLLAGFEGLRDRIDQMPEVVRVLRLGQAAEWLAELYAAVGKPEEAAKWRAEREKYRELAPPPRELGR